MYKYIKVFSKKKKCDVVYIIRYILIYTKMTQLHQKTTDIKAFNLDYNCNKNNENTFILKAITCV